jgi:hypothetical protein
VLWDPCDCPVALKLVVSVVVFAVTADAEKSSTAERSKTPAIFKNFWFFIIFSPNSNI